MLHLRVVTVALVHIVMLACFSGSSVATQSSLVMTEDTSLAGRIFNTSMLFEVTTKTKLQCVARCARAPICVSVAVTSSTSATVTCRAYTMSMTSASAFSPTPGSKYYVTSMPARTSLPDISGNILAYVATYSSWLRQACTTTGPCGGVANSDCVKSLCQCSVNYYYSITADACVESCRQESIQPLVCCYALVNINGYDIVSAPSGYTLNMCKTESLAKLNCRSFTYATSTNSCYQKYVAPSPSLPANYSAITSHFCKRVCG